MRSAFDPFLSTHLLVTIWKCKASYKSDYKYSLFHTYTDKFKKQRCFFCLFWQALLDRSLPPWVIAQVAATFSWFLFCCHLMTIETVYKQYSWCWAACVCIHSIIRLSSKEISWFICLQSLSLYGLGVGCVCVYWHLLHQLVTWQTAVLCLVVMFIMITDGQLLRTFHNIIILNSSN